MSYILLYIYIPRGSVGGLEPVWTLPTEGEVPGGRACDHLYRGPGRRCLRGGCTFGKRLRFRALTRKSLSIYIHNKRNYA